MSNYDLADLGPQKNDQDLSDLGPSQQQQSMPWYQSIPRSLAAGATATIVNTPHDVSSLIGMLPSNKIAQTFQTTMGLPNIDIPEVARTIAKVTPYYEKQEMLSKFGVDNPGQLEDISYYAPEIYGVGHAATSLLRKGLPYAGRFLGDVIGSPSRIIEKQLASLNPEGKAQNLLGKLRGEHDYTQNNQVIPNMVEGKYKEAKEVGGGKYKEGDDLAGDYQFKGSNFSNLPENVMKDVETVKGVSDIHDEGFNNKYSILDLNGDQFKIPPSFSEASKLKSQLGYNIRSLERRMYSPLGLDQVGKDTLINLRKAKNAINMDIEDHLGDIKPEASKAYRHADKWWAENVIPYRKTKDMLKMATGDVEDPRNILSTFRNPEADTKKVVSDLGEEGKRRILASYLGKFADDPAKLAKMASKNNLQVQGLDHYLNDDILEDLKSIREQSLLKENLTKNLLEADKARKSARWKASIGAATVGVPSGLLKLKHFLP